MKRNKKKKGNLLKRYNDAGVRTSNNKINGKVVALKSGVDLGVSTLGAGLGALGGIFSPIAGVALILAGHFLNDKSGILRMAGAATMAYGIAKAADNRMASQNQSVNGISLGSVTEGAKNRLINFKDNWLQAFYIDKLTGSKKESLPAEDQTIGAIDLSSLDVFEEMNKESAINFELSQRGEQVSFEEEDEFEEEMEMEDAEDFFEEEFEDQESEDLEGLSYAIMDEDEIDFSIM